MNIPYKQAFSLQTRPAHLSLIALLAGWLTVMLPSLAPQASAGDASLARAFAVSAAKLNSEGKPEKAKSLCYQALANDEQCADALYELGIIFHAEGRSVLAGSFFARAIQSFGKGGANEPDQAKKLRNARNLALTTNPYALKLSTVMEQYAKELQQAAAASPDRLTEDAARGRAAKLTLAQFVPAERMPDFGKTEPPTPPIPEDKGDKTVKTDTRVRSPEHAGKKGVTKAPPEIERELKALGWTTITGTWVKLGKDQYQVTDGRLNAELNNGMLGAFVHKEGQGSVSIFVRTMKRKISSYYGTEFDSSYTADGYGVTIRNSACSVYMPSNSYYTSNSSYYPYKDHDKILPVNYPKNHFLVQLLGTKLEVFLNNKSLRKTSYPIDDGGTFSIIVEGTRVIEAPNVKGQ